MYSKKFLEEQETELFAALNTITTAQTTSTVGWDSIKLIQLLFKKLKFLAKLLRKIKATNKKRKKLLEEEYLQKTKEMIELLLSYLKEEKLNHKENIKETECLFAVSTSLFTISSTLLAEKQKAQNNILDQQLEIADPQNNGIIALPITKSKKHKLHIAHSKTYGIKVPKLTTARQHYIADKSFDVNGIKIDLGDLSGKSPSKTKK